MGHNQVLIVFSKIETPVKPGAYSRYYTSLPPSVQTRIDGYMNEKDKVLGSIGKQLLLHALERSGYVASIEGLTYASNNRPYLEGVTGLDFNISHSGSMVVCALSKHMRVGIDIEEIKPIKSSPLKGQFSMREWEEIENAPDPQTLFYSYWAKKEALVKADGFNDSVVFSDLEVIFNHVNYRQKSWYLSSLNIDPNYSSWLATEDVPHIEMEQVFFNP